MGSGMILYWITYVWPLQCDREIVGLFRMPSLLTWWFRALGPQVPAARQKASRPFMTQHRSFHSIHHTLVIELAKSFPILMGKGFKEESVKECALIF